MGVKGDSTKKMIREKARILFADNGFTRLTMKDICEATGLSRGGLYRHYSSTEEILMAILTDTDDKKDEIQKAGSSATDRLEAYLKKCYDEMLEGEHSLSLAFYEFALQNHSEMFRIGTMVAHNKLVKLIEDGIATGEFKEVDPDVVADGMLFAYQGARMWGHVMKLDEAVPAHIIDNIRLILYK